MAYLPLSTANLPDPAINPAQGASPEDYFGTLLWSGDDNTTRTIQAGGSGVTGDINFTPDFAWIKRRNGATNGSDHMLLDAVRGVGSFNALSCNGSYEEGRTEAGSYWVNFGDIDTFTTDGFTVQKGSDGSHTLEGINESGGTYVGWNWLANGSGSTIAVDTYSAGSPSIASTVSANTTSGFSIVKYTGTNDTTNKVAHGLDQKPQAILLKKLTASTDWAVYHESVCTDDRHFLYLNTNAARTTGGATRWDISAFDTDTFTVGDDHSVNAASTDYIAYCFHSVEGFSKFGSYVGNGSSDGPFVYTGLRPALVIIKESSNTGSWLMIDTTRDPYNMAGTHIGADSIAAEATAASRTPPFGIDYLSNGFKLRGSHDEINQSSQTYIYMAFAENPFKYSNAR